MMPIDLILIRHGKSEGNKANEASRKGDNRFFTPEFRERHSSSFRLTDTGISQARAAGAWLRENVAFPLDRYYASNYLRAMETAALLGLPKAQWRLEFHLRERDMALMDNMPQSEKNDRFAQEQLQWSKNQFLSTPAGGGESVAQLCMRLKATVLEHWARECSDKRIIVVCHGHVMRALQVEMEGLLPNDFNRLDESEDPKDKIHNCQVIWYSRRDPNTLELKNGPVAVRSVCPWDTKRSGDEWRYLAKKTWSNLGLLEEVAKTPRMISGC